MQRQTQHFADLNDVIVALAKKPYSYRLDDHPAIQYILSASRDEQRRFVRLAIAWLRSPLQYDYCVSTWRVIDSVTTLLRRKLPFEYDDIITILDWAMLDRNCWQFGSAIVKLMERYSKDHPLTPELSVKIEQLIDIFQSYYPNAAQRRWIAGLQDLLGITTNSLPLLPGDVWANAAIADINALDETLRSAWIELLVRCAQANAAKPSDKWLKAARSFVESIGHADFVAALLRWFPLVDKPRTERIELRYEWMEDQPLMIQDTNVDILRGLVWLCTEYPDQNVVRALTALAISTYRKVPGIGPRCVRVGNACVWALGQMPDTIGIAQLALLKAKVRVNAAQKAIERTLTAAAERTGLPPAELEEMLVPTYGLQEVGRRCEQLGDFTAELVIQGTKAAELHWIRADGKRLSTVPRSVKEQHAEALKDLKQAATDIKKMLPAQRDRIERSYLERKTWSYPTWRERYLEHPLVGTLAQRLLWTFRSDAQTGTGIWHAGQIVANDGSVLDWLDETTQVELWHPLNATTEDTLAWRDWLTTHEVQQPFKQAHREIYLLTDAERTTRLYSNRFAAHIIRQHQFNALCDARGWKNQLRLMVDDSYPPAYRHLTAWGLRAEFWVEGIGDNYGTDTNDTGTYLYLNTDQVRFYPLDAAQNFAYAGGGGYTSYHYGTAPIGDPVPIEQIPALALSEILRDVDLFVGVASVGNDPTWADGGPEGRHQNYWMNYSFGNLSEAAKLRREVLERLLPRLKIADQCSLSDRFLKVRGDIRTYHIHLGSSNILMEPNDQYLCIVPARNAATTATDSKLFLPFEGDNMLAIILSKALLLAKDTQIKDSTILQQIRR